MVNTEKVEVLVTKSSASDEHYLQEKLGSEYHVHIVPEELSEIDRDLLRRARVLIPFIHSHIGKGEIAYMPALRLIATRSTGIDHIDIKLAKERQIAVTNVPAYGETAVAEFTFALLLALTRKLYHVAIQHLLGVDALSDLKGIDLYGKTLGVVGTGAIGRRVIQIAHGFGMRVVAYDTRRDKQLAEKYDFESLDLPDLLAQSDIVTIHVPAIPSTFHMFNRETLGQMKKGSILVNTARGSIVDTHALSWALDAGILHGAALDTIEGEELQNNEDELLYMPEAEEKLKLFVQNHALSRNPNVLITPHIAFNTNGALQRILDVTVENVKHFEEGKARNLV